MIIGSLGVAGAEAGLTTTLTERVEGTTISDVSHAGVSSGSKSITLTEGELEGTVTVLLKHKTVFVEGNDCGLQGLGLSAAAGAAEAGRWLKLTGGATAPEREQTLFQSASVGLTVTSAVDAIAAIGVRRVVLSVAAVAGRLTIPVRTTGVAADGGRFTVTVYIEAGIPTLPLEVVTTISTGLKETKVFSGWGQAPVVVAPVGAVPFKVAWLQTAGASPAAA